MSKAYRNFLNLKKSLTWGQYFYGLLFYSMNLTSIFITFYLGIIAIIFLAGINSNYLGGENPYKDPLFLHATGFYPILTTVANSVIALITGLISFFLINNKFQDKKRQLKKLKFEEIAFRTNIGEYANLNTQIAKEYRLYKRCLHFIEVDRYTTSALKGETSNE